MTKSFAFRLTLTVALTIVCATSIVLLVAGWHLGDRHMDTYIPLSLIIIGVTILLSLPIGYFLSRYMLAPLNAIEESARRIRANNLQERVYVPENNRELASLATEFNRAFDDLETAFGQIRRFTADASHELKTPLTLIRLNAEKLRKQHETGCPHATVCEPLMASLHEEIDSMRRIIDSLLFIARVDAGALDIERVPRDMRACIEDFAEDGRTLAEDKGLVFEVGQNAPGAPAFDPDNVRQLLLNLTSNAIAVSPVGGKITLDSAPAGEGRWRLSITDEGPGVPADALESMFTRFWRLRQSSTPPFNASGHGLGLAICKSIATLHGGTLRAENRADRTGLRIIFEW